MKKIITNSEFFRTYNLSSVKNIYKNWADEYSPDSDTVSFTEWLDMEYVQPKTYKYKWVCSSEDRFFEDSNRDFHETFNTQEEAYNSMKDSAINRVAWYADYSEVIEDCCPFDSKTTKLTETPDDMGVHCNIEFHPHKIILDINGCIYEYTIKNIID